MKGKLLYLLAILAMLAGAIPAAIPAVASDEEVITLPPFKPPEIVNSKLDTHLNQLLSVEAPEEIESYAQTFNIGLEDGNIRVVVECVPGQFDAAIDAAVALGAVIETSPRDQFQISVPLSNLTALAETPAIRLIRMPINAVTYATSEGVTLINADDWQAAGYTGAGVKIAILDVGFDGYESLQGTELPSSVTTNSFMADGDIHGPDGQPVDHGTACAEIVYDIAPDAEFYLVNYGNGLELLDAVDYLIGEGVDIISHSCGHPLWGPGDGSGIICDKIAEARANGILWSQAMGNYGLSHWQGDWADSGNDYLDFTGTDELIWVYLPPDYPVNVSLRWDDPWGTSANNYDMLLFGNPPEWPPVLGSFEEQDGTGGDDYPCEGFTFTPQTVGWYSIAVHRTSASGLNHFHLYVYPYDIEEVHQVASGSLTVPADSTSAMSVGAVPWDDPVNLEEFSSQGPNINGDTKPDLVAPDGVENSTYNPFNGTSASTPHAAGAAALVLDAYPGYAPAEIQAYLESEAIEISGDENMYGSGWLYLGAAPASGGGSISGYVYEDDGITPIEDARVGAFEFGLLPPVPPIGEDYTDASGYYSITGLPAGDYRVSAGKIDYERLDYPDSNIISHGDPVTVAEGQDTYPINFSLSPGGIIAGTVTAQDGGAPLSDISVVTGPPNVPGYYSTAITDENGHYILPGLPYGDYVVNAPAWNKPGAGDDSYMAEFWQEKSINMGSDIVTVEEGVSPDYIDFTLEVGGTISGHVENEAGAPIVYELLYIWDYDSLWGQWIIRGVALTDTNGDYETVGLPAGRYGVQTRCDGYAWEWYDDTYIHTQATPVEVTGPGSNTPNINFVLEPGGSISGTVYDSNGMAPIPGFNVQAFDPATNQWMAGSNTDDSGNYTLAGLPEGSYYVRSCASCSGMGYADKYYNDAYSRDDATIVTVYAQTDTPGINFTLEDGGYISGTVTNYDGSIPLANVSVDCKRTIDGNWDWHGARTDDNGNYILAGLPYGDYVIRSPSGGRWAGGDDGYVIEYYNSKVNIEEADLLTINESTDHESINFTLDVGGSISGTVYESNGTTPIANLHVQAFDPATNAWMAGSNTDDSGNYILAGVPVGDCYVRACASCSGMDYAEEWYNGAYSRNNATIVTVYAQTDTPDINFTLEDGGYISGTVTNYDGSIPLANVSVECKRTIDSDWDWHGTTTDSNGNYSLHGMPYGDYVVRSPGGGKWGAGDDGYIIEHYNNKANIDEADLVTVDDVTNPTGIDFTLEVGGSISGYVYEADGTTPIVNLHVQAFDVPGNQWQAGMNTDASGYYELTGLSEGDYYVRACASCSGHPFIEEWYDDAHSQDEATSVHVSVGGNTQNINFSLDPGGSISGYVHATDGGAPIEGAQIDAVVYNTITGHRVHLGWAQTNSEGYYKTSALPTGVYGIWVRADGYATEWWQDTYHQDEAKAISVTAPENISGIDFSLEIGGSISGNVYESDGTTPIPNLHVQAFDSNTGQWMAGADTVASGHYVLTGLPEGNYNVKACASCSGYPFIEEWYDDVYSQNEAVDIQVSPPGEIPDINFYLGHGATISGYVKDESDNPIVGATVAAIDYDSLLGYRIERSRNYTDENGYYETSALPDGSYAVQASADGYAIEWYDDTHDPNTATAVEAVAPNNVSDINFNLGPGGSISGHAEDGSGNPISNLLVVAIDNLTNQGINAGITNDDGDYTIPSLPEGDYWVRTVTEWSGLPYNDKWYNNVPRQDEATSVTVTVPYDTPDIDFVLAGLPDLVVTAKWEEWVVDGKSYQVHFTIKNIGDSGVPPGHDVALGLDYGVEMVYKEVPEVLGPGEEWSSYFDIVIDLTGESDSPAVIVDFNDEVRELNEFNNVRTNTISWPPAPDLVVSEKYEEWVDEGVYTVHFTVLNQGNGDAPSGNVSLTIDGMLLQRRSTPPLDAGESHSASFGTVSLTDGVDSVMVCADATEDIAESIETNNCRVNIYAEPPAPDLIIRGGREDWVDQDTYTVSCIVENLGNAVAPAGFDVGMRVNGVPTDIVEVSVDLPPGQSRHIFYATQINVGGGTDEITVCADVNHEVTELREDNNCQTNEFPGPAPDLVIWQKYEEWVEEHNTYKVHFTIKNMGEGDARAGYTLALFLDYVFPPLETKVVPVSLAPGETWSSGFDTVITLTDGLDIVSISADASSLIYESDELNNFRTNFISWPAMPDLVISNLFEDWVDDGIYEVNFTVLNRGNAAADAGHDVVLSVDGPPVETFEIPVALAQGESYWGSFSTPIDVTGGWDTVTVCADINDEVAESDEAGNCRIDIVSWPPAPDLEILSSSMTWVDEGVYTVCGQIRNNGNAPALPGHDISLTVDGMTIATMEFPVLMQPGTSQGFCFPQEIAVSDDADEITLCADANDEVAESREDNNCLRKIFPEAVEVRINAPDTVPPDDDFVATIDIIEVTDFWGGQYDIWFDESVLSLDDVTGGLIGSTDIPVEFNTIGGDDGHWRILHYLPGSTTASGSGYLAELHFHSIGDLGTDSDIYITDGAITDFEMNKIPAIWLGDHVEISVIPGDANGDKVVNIFDMTKVARIILELDDPTPGADANQDTFINIFDMTKIARIILELD